MIFFMTRKHFEEYLKKCFENIITQYGIDIIAESLDGIIGDIASIKREVRNNIHTVDTLHNKYNSEFDKYYQILQTSISNDKILEEKIIKIQSLKNDIVREIKDEILLQLPKSGINAEDSKKIADEVKNIYNNEIYQIKNSLAQELNNKNILINKIQRQDEIIKNLTSTVSRMESEITELKKLLIHPNTPEIPIELENSPASTVLIGVIFGNDSGENEKIINNFIHQTKNLRNELITKFNNNRDIEIYLKLVDKCITKMESLYLRNEKNGLNSEKLANECVKILKQTIVRAMSQDRLKNLLDTYMQNCKIRKLEWHIGKIMEDEDYEYLEEPILYENVSMENLNNTIRAIKQDTYIIDYFEDDEKYEAIIPGIYCIGRYRN